MSATLSRVLRCAVVMAAATFIVTAGLASAHGHAPVGDYDLVIGFHNEPAYQGQPNALDLFVTDTRSNQKVEGLADTLKAEIIYGASKKELPLEPQEDTPGAYTAYLIPTRTGDYTWHIFGSINGTPVDVSMTSGPDTFGTVEAQAELAFPAAEPSASELQTQAAAATRTAQFALAAGVLGLLASAAGILLARRASRAP